MSGLAPSVAWLLLAAPPLVPLAFTLVNLVTWGPATARARPPRTSALVPARNEAAGIAACVEALLREPFTEVIVCDDRSTDETPAILAALAARDPRLRVLQGSPLPSGRVGKAHACHQLAGAASGELLVFVDADTLVQPHALERVAAAMADADVASLLPRQETGSAGEGLVLPLLHLTYTSWLPLRLVRTVANPRVLAANGQLLAVRRDAYTGMGGYAAVANEVVDDMAFCRAAKRAGLRVAFVDGALVATCRMYRSGREAWEGFSKNLYEGIGASTAAVGIAANLLQRVMLARRFAHPGWSVPLHPLGILAFLGLALNSWRWSRRGAIHWRGRTYAARAARGGA